MLQDLKFSIRSFIKRPALTFAILLTLALGIGANSVMFTVVDTVLLRTLPFHEPDRLVTIWNRYDVQKTLSSPPDYIDRRDQSELVERVTAISQSRMNLSSEGEPEQVRVSRVTASFFEVFGIEALPAPVRFAQEEAAELDDAAVIGHGLWQRRFGGDLSAIGQTIRLDGEPYRISGIMPAGFDYPRDTDVWIARQFTPEQLADDFRGNEFLTIVGRLHDGATLDEARAEMNVIAARVIERVPDRAPFLERNGWGASVVPLAEDLVGAFEPALFVLWGAVGLVLLIACANVANLLLARAESRARELDVRVSLGASRGRLIQQLLTESVVLALAGAALGLALASAVLRILPNWVPHELPRLHQVSLDPRVVLFTLFLALATAFIFGLAPAWRATTTRQRGRRLTHMLIVNEVAIAVVLLIGAGLLFKSYRALTAIDPGFAAEQRLSFRVTLPNAAYSDAAARQRFTNAYLERLRALPGVKKAGASFRVPLDGENWTATFYPEHYELAPGEATPGAEFNVVSPGYLDTLDIPLVRGRDFTSSDHAEASRVALIDEATAERYWPEGNAVGSRINLGRPDRDPNFREIVGIVGRVKNTSLDETGRAQLYLSSDQSSTRNVSFSIETASDPWLLLDPARRELLALDPDLPPFAIRSLDELVRGATALPQFNLAVLGGFAMLALGLAALGVYSVLSYSVSTRTGEIGMRMALGARSSNIVKLVLRQAAGLVALGLAIGWGAAIALTRFMATLLYEVAPNDIATFGTISGVLLVAAFIAALLPARRAASLDPIKALRTD